jgi:hypothetical protein
VLDVDTASALGASDLRGGQSDSLRGVHRVEHVASRPQLVRDVGDGLRFVAKDRISKDRECRERSRRPCFVVGADADPMMRAMRPRSTTRGAIRPT